MLQRPTRFLLLAAMLLTGAAAPAPNYKVIDSIAAPGDGGWDYAAFDPSAKRVYVTHGATVVMADVVHGTASEPFSGIAKGHAAIPIAAGNLVAVTSGHDDSVRLFDMRSGSEVAKVAVGTDPDAAFYDASAGRLIVMNAKGGDSLAGRSFRAQSDRHDHAQAGARGGRAGWRYLARQQ